MESIFRTHIVFEMIDKETGEVVYREVSKSKEFDSVAEMLGYIGADSIESELTVKDELVTYGNDGFPKEPDVRTHELSESVKKVVYEDPATEPDVIFADMDVPEVESDDDAFGVSDDLASIDPTILTESLAGDTDNVNDFGEVSDMSLDLDDADGKEEKQYHVEELFETPIDDSSDAIIDLSGLELDFDNDEDPSDVVVSKEDVTPELDDDQPFENEEEENTFKARMNRVSLDNLFE